MLIPLLPGRHQKLDRVPVGLRRTQSVQVEAVQSLAVPRTGVALRVLRRRRTGQDFQSLHVQRHHKAIDGGVIPQHLPRHPAIAGKVTRMW